MLSIYADLRNLNEIDVGVRGENIYISVVGILPISQYRRTVFWLNII